MSDRLQLYQQVILDHNKRPRNYGSLPEATHAVDGLNPLCGDQLKVYLRVSGEGLVEDVRFEGHGCAISKASASMMTESIKGKKAEEVGTIFESFMSLVKGKPTEDEDVLGKLVVFEGVRRFPARVKCATLAWHAAHAAVNGEGKIGTDGASVSTE